MHFKEFLIEDKNNVDFEAEFFRIKYIFEFSDNGTFFEDDGSEFRCGIKNSVIKNFHLYDKRNTNLSFYELEEKIYNTMGFNENMNNMSATDGLIKLGINEENLLFYIEFVYSITKFLEKLLSEGNAKNIENHEFLTSQMSRLFNHIELVLSNLNYTIVEEDGVYSVVAMDGKTLVDEVVDSNTKKSLYEYIAVSNKNDVIKKRDMLKIIANDYERIRRDISNIDDKLNDRISFVLNNCEIRHNNVDETSAKFHKVTKELSDEEFIRIYDYLFYMYLYANLLVKYNDSVEKVLELRNVLDGKKVK